MKTEKKYLFIHVNKCGGTSMKQAFKNVKSIWIPPANKLINLAKEEKWNQLNKFSIVRHPVSRLLSLQGMLLKLRRKHISLTEIMDLVEDPSISYYKFSNQKEYIKRHALPFTHPHYQVYRGGKLNIDKIWRLEELDTAKEEMESFLNTKLSIPKKNTSTHKELNPKEKERIIKVYKEDIEAMYRDFVWDL